ncbi:MAG: hypothetical protein EAZ97_14085 [Bacteroidetes bacterium]|nr:MAG: hypothetical protein EAZ97_14085 [Bacteroidota bacterium]
MANKKGILETIIGGTARVLDKTLDALNPLSKSETKKPVAKKAPAKAKVVAKTVKKPAVKKK